MDYRDYYALLGVTPTASSDQITQAYRSLVRRYHPDRHQGDHRAEDMLKQINEAYEVLSDPIQRRTYDRLTQNHQQRSQPSGLSGSFQDREWDDAAFGRATADSLDASDLVSDFLRHCPSQYTSSPAGSGQPFQGQDLELATQITLEEAFWGTQRSVGAGPQSITVTIPRGIRHGWRVRVPGKGISGLVGGETGDLFVIVEVLEHPIFRREENDLHVDVSMDLYTAVLGGSIMIPTMNGEVEAQLQPGTQPDYTIRLRGYGMPNPKQPDKVGDLYARVHMQIPTRLSPEEQRLFERLRILAAR